MTLTKEKQLENLKSNLKEWEKEASSRKNKLSSYNISTDTISQFTTSAFISYSTKNRSTTDRRHPDAGQYEQESGNIMIVTNRDNDSRGGYAGGVYYINVDTLNGRFGRDNWRISRKDRNWARKRGITDEATAFIKEVNQLLYELSFANEGIRKMKKEIEELEKGGEEKKPENEKLSDAEVIKKEKAADIARQVKKDNPPIQGFDDNFRSASTRDKIAMLKKRNDCLAARKSR